MSSVSARFPQDFSSPDMVKEMPKAKALVHDFGEGRKCTKVTAEPGWTWKGCIQPIVGGESCQLTHFGFCTKGTMKVMMENGETMNVSAGQVIDIIV